jgi:hypothetical protein
VEQPLRRARQCGRTDRDRHARCAAKWLKTCAVEQVGREELRREALGQAIDAGDTDRVIQRLEQGGAIRLSTVIQGGKGGRAARRWAVKCGSTRVREHCANCANQLAQLAGAFEGFAKVAQGFGSGGMYGRAR